MSLTLPERVIPSLEAVHADLVKYRGVDPSTPLDFWRSSDLSVRESGFYSLSFELLKVACFSDDEIGSLPSGYKLVSGLLSWESECANEGWGAFGYLAEKDVGGIIDCYRWVGLRDEAEGLARAYVQWQKTPSDFEKIGRAYRSKQNAYDDDMKRVPYIVRFLAENSEALFYVPAST